MRWYFSKTKILFFILLLGSVLALNLWPKHNSPTPNPGTTISHTKVAGRTPKTADFIPLKSAEKQSVVRFNDQASRLAFVKANNLSDQDLNAVPGLANTYTVNKSPTDLVADGALVAEQKTYTALLTPNDPIYPQWYTDKISAPAAWDITTGSSSTIVADIDTGFALNHEDLTGRWASGGYDFVNNDSDPSAGTTNPNGSAVSHGTTTAGLIGATGNNAKGVASINWSTKILPLQALNDDGQGLTTTVAAAMHYAVDHGAKVINMSLGTAGSDPIISNEVDYATAHDVLIVAAAGNCGSPSSYFLNGCSQVGQMVYPANYPQVLAVGASDSNDNRASFSSYGPNLDVVAPGTGTIISPGWSAANQTSAYTSNISGTSFSTPIVAGLAALYRGFKPTASLSDSVSAITGNTDKVSGMSGQSFTNFYGYGRIDAAKVLQSAVPTPPSQPLIHPDGSLILSSDRSAVLLIEGGKRRTISSGDVFNSYGFNWGSIDSPTSADNNLPAGNDLNSFREGTLVSSNGTIYVIDTLPDGSSQKRAIGSWDIFVSLGYSLSQVMNVPNSELPAANGPTVNTADTHPDGSLILSQNRTAVMLIEDGKRRTISNGDVFNSYGFSWGYILNPTAGDNNLPVGNDLNSFREGTLVNNNGTIYVIDTLPDGSTQKRAISSWNTFVALGYNLGEVMNVPTAELPAANGPSV